MSETTKFELKAATVDLNLQRPWVGPDGKAWVTLQGGEDVPVAELPNRGIARSPAFSLKPLLTKEQWKHLDARVNLTAKYCWRTTRMFAEACPFGGFNGVARAAIEYEDAPNDVDEDKPRFKLNIMPLPICHTSFKDRPPWPDAVADMDGLSPPAWVHGDGVRREFSFAGLLEQAEAGARRVAERVERAVLGVNLPIGEGSWESVIWGLLTYPNARRYSFDPETHYQGKDAGKRILELVEGMIDGLLTNGYPGPYLMVHSNTMDQYLDADFEWNPETQVGCTVRERLRRIPQIHSPNPDDKALTNVVRADLLDGYCFALVQLTPDVVQIVEGLPLTVVQWEDGLFKLLTITWPRFKSDRHGHCGVAVAEEVK